jgi:hypothetical protein
MFKVRSHDSFEHLKHKLWAKEGSGAKLTLWFPTIKRWESTQLPWVQVACDIPLQSSRRRLQFCFRLHFHRKSAHKVMGPQSCGSPNIDNFGTKNHLDVGLVERCRVYYKGEGGGLLQVRAVVSFVTSSLLVGHPSTKSVPTRH